MKAIICEKFGNTEDLKFVEIEKPSCGDHQVLIEVHACSINFPDTLIIQGKYQFKPPFPFSPGSDLSGIVVAKGKEVTTYNIGDEIIAITLCGGLAEYAVVDVDKCMPKPNKLTFEEASAFLYTYSTALYALKNRGGISKNDTVLILGAAGGIGMASIQLAKHFGASVIAAASTHEKLDKCKSAGADFLINYTDEDLKNRSKEITNKKGVDLVLDVVGGKYAEPSLRAIAWEGRYLVVGFASGEIPKFPLNLALLKGCQIVGVFLGAFSQKQRESFKLLNEELMTLVREGKIKPQIQNTFPLKDAPKAIQMMADRKAIGKLVIKIK